MVLANSSPADCGRDRKAHKSSIRFITRMMENSLIDFAKQKTTPRRSTRWLVHTQPIAHALPAQLERLDRKSTRLNSSHVEISYAVFCLKKKKEKHKK